MRSTRRTPSSSACASSRCSRRTTRTPTTTARPSRRRSPPSTSELDRIASTTQFNGQNLLDGTGGTAGSFTFQVGANSGQTVAVAFNKADTTTLGTTGADVSTQAGAASALTSIDAAIKTVSGNRADLGAVQNRLQHTINSLSVASENAAAAESRIRDTDMAKEMTAFTRSQILSQAGVSMLAQANSVPQSVLKLLG